MDQQQWESEVMHVGDSYTQGEYSNFPLPVGPNSNTGADNILENAGGYAPDIPKAYGQNYGE